MLQLIRHYFQTKIYHAVENIENEIKQKKRKELLNSIKIVGLNPDIDKESYIQGAKYMILGDNFHCGKNSWIAALDSYGNQQFMPKLIVGDNFSMQYNCHIGCIEKIEIGDNVLLGSKVYITDHYHGKVSYEDIDVPPIQRGLTSKPVKICNNVWVGDNVSIMPGVILEDNIIVGANAVVTHSFPRNVVIAGVPAKIIKELK